jgi:hypothetical protein
MIWIFMITGMIVVMSVFVHMAMLMGVCVFMFFVLVSAASQAG